MKVLLLGKNNTTRKKESFRIGIFFFGFASFSFHTNTFTHFPRIREKNGEFLRKKKKIAEETRLNGDNRKAVEGLKLISFAKKTNERKGKPEIIDL